MVNLLDTPVEYLKGVGPLRAEILRKETGIRTFGELLLYYPFRYVDRSKFYTVAEVNTDTAWLQLKENHRNANVRDRSGPAFGNELSR